MRNSLISLAAGALLTLGFAPFNVYTLSFISPAILCWLWLDCPPKKAALYGLVFGLGFFGTSINWVYHSIHVYGNASAILAAFIVFLLIISAALFPAAQGWGFAYFFKNKSYLQRCLYAFPLCWLICEWIRGHIFTGFPWMMIGYTATHNLLQWYAPLIGLYGLSLITALISGCIVLLLKERWQPPRLVALTLIVIIIGVSYFIPSVTYTTVKQNPLTVSLIQGNIQQSMKWNEKDLENIIHTYYAQTKAHKDSDLIIWPEAAIPTLASNVPQVIDQLHEFTKKNQNALIIGVPTYDTQTQQYFNSLLLLTPTTEQQYNKVHLVPFGEYIPLSGFFGYLFNTLNIPMSNFSAGSKTQPLLDASQIKIAPYICYEIAFPQQVLTHSHGANVLLVISDDSWFGPSIALDQHLQMAQMRALELQKYVLFATNTGATAIIKPDGSMTSLDRFKADVLTQTIEPTQGDTPLSRFGYTPVALICLILLILSLRHKKTPQEKT